MGATLVAGALPYSLAGYSGLSVNIETGQALGFVVKTSGNGYFQETIGPTSGAQTYTVNLFSSFAMRGDSQVSTLNLTQVTDIQPNVLDPSVGYGLGGPRAVALLGTQKPSPLQMNFLVENRSRFAPHPRARLLRSSLAFAVGLAGLGGCHGPTVGEGL